MNWVEMYKQMIRETPPVRIRSVKVEGITMTEPDVDRYLALLQKAKQELDAMPKVKNLDRVVSPGGTPGVVLVGFVQKNYIRGLQCSLVTGGLTVVSEHGSGHTYNSEEALLSSWSLVQQD